MDLPYQSEEFFKSPRDLDEINSTKSCFCGRALSYLQGRTRPQRHRPTAVLSVTTKHTNDTKIISKQRRVNTKFFELIY